MPTVNCEGIDQSTLISALWKHQILAGFFRGNSFLAPQLSNIELNSALNTNIDYLAGRAIKINFRNYEDNHEIESFGYDRDANDSSRS